MKRMTTTTAGTSGRHRPSLAVRWRRLTPYFMLAPAFVLMGVILMYPAIQNMWLSFMSWRYTDLSSSHFVGLDNYRRLLFEDMQFWEVLRFTMLFVVSTIVLEFLLGLGAALLLYRVRSVRSLFTALTLLPYQVAPIAAGLIWRLLWAHNFGLVNYGLETIGLEPVVWLGLSGPAKVASIITEVWRSTPFVTIVLLAGLTSIPLDLTEAAQVDGAGPFARFRHIIFPLLLPSVAVALMFETIFKLRVFDLIFNPQGCGPGRATMPLGILIYRIYFRYFEGGYAAALSVILLIIGAVFSYLYIRFVYREGDY
jgi:multiple sugar transport system permease protein